MAQVQLISVTPEQLQNAIIEGVKLQIEELKKFYQPKEPTEYMERSEVAKMLNVNLSTIHNWSKSNILVPFGIGRRVYFKRTQVEQAIIKLNK